LLSASDPRATLSSDLIDLLETFTGAGVALLDAEGRVLGASAGFWKIASDGEEIRGGVLADLIAPESGGPLPDPAESSGAEAPGVRCIAKGGDCALPLELRIEALSSFPDRYVALVRDRRDAERFEEYLVHSERLRKLGEMCLGLVHQLNNLLAVVSLGAEVPGTDGEPQLELIKQAADDAASVLRRVQRFARPHSQTEPARWTDLGELVNDSLDFTRPRWQTEPNALRPSIQLETSITSGVGVIGVASDLREVVVNLILNAVDALPHGGRIKILCDVDGKDARLRFEDTGEGMQKDVRARLFEPFFSTKGAAGLGLGLSIVASIVERHGGSIAVDSLPARGTTFEVRLPLAEDAGPERAEDAAVARERLRPWRILVVEDESALRLLLMESLGEAGHQVEAVASAEAAEARLAGPVSWDLIVTDLSLPGRSGLDLARAARARRRDLPVLLVTAWGLEMNNEALATHGVSAVLSKPFRRKSLYAALERLQRDAGDR
jgi:signal transduction histidine kinase/CheY-like chemotaxis protein